MILEYRHARSPQAFDDLPDGCADAIVTDPPYGTGRGDSIYGRRREGKANRIANDTDLSELVAVAPAMARLLADEGIALVFCAPQFRADVEAIIADTGLLLLGAVPWDKGAPGISYRIRYAYEDSVLAAREGYDPWETREPLIVPLRHSRVLESKHPNEKPVSLLRQIIRWALPHGGLVVDPFAGVASCGVAAKLEGCSYIGAEMDEQWIAVGRARMDAVAGRSDDLPLFQTTEDSTVSHEEIDTRVYEHLRTEAKEDKPVAGNLRRIGAATGVKPGTVWGALQRLAANGKIERAGAEGRSTLWKVA